mmetsp:Transcript_27845/g.83192  ORF Transcript_27845/g.83192 Transcript_27845/m.83192 type:complete len:357 (+) Transcript_27845:64-1134(+)
MAGQDGSESETELDCRCWSVQPRMAPLCACEKAVRPGRQAVLAAAARGMFSRVGNTTYWVGAGDEPRTLLEQFALQVFWHHLTRLGWSREAVLRLGKAAGAEYWVQKRSPKQPLGRRSINWHYDKDEALVEDYGIMIHPLVATATYLCRGGAPLVVLTKPTLDTGPDGASVAPLEGCAADAFVVFPAPGRHAAFRGKLLHGCPAELEGRSGERLSVLVNVWLHHKPFDLCRWRLRARLRSQSLCKLRGGGLARLFSPGAEVPPSRVRLAAGGAGADGEFAVQSIPFGPWQLSGLRVPRAPREGVWVVRQSPGQLSVSLRAERRQAQRRKASPAVKRRPAAAPDAGPRKRPRSAGEG